MVIPKCLRPYLLPLELTDRDPSAAIVDAEYACIENLEEVTTQTTVMSVIPGPDNNENQQNIKLFNSIKESMTVHAELAAKQEQQFHLTSIQVP